MGSRYCLLTAASLSRSTIILTTTANANSTASTATAAAVAATIIATTTIVTFQGKNLACILLSLCCMVPI